MGAVHAEQSSLFHTLNARLAGSDLPVTARGKFCIKKPKFSLDIKYWWTYTCWWNPCC